MSPRRIAVITSETPNSRDAGSMQLLRVFRGYPPEQLFVLGPTTPAGAKLLPCPYRALPYPVMRLRKTRFHVPAMSAALALRPLRPSAATIDRLLGQFRPEAVFTVMDCFSHYYTAYRYARARGLPLLTVTMDEPDCFERIYPALASLRHRKITSVYRYASANLCVSKQMTAHIATDFGGETETFYFGPPDGQSPRPAEEAAPLRQPTHLTLGYAGSLSYGYGEAIRRIAAALRDRSIRIRIYSKDTPDWPEVDNVDYAGVFTSEELWPRVKADCDASLLVYNPDYGESRLYRTHFPTKLSEYAWLGMPMVMVGPDYATGIIWGQQHPEATIVESSANLTDLGSALDHLRRQPAQRVTMARAAAAAARAEFDPARIRRRFHEVLAGA